MDKYGLLDEIDASFSEVSYPYGKDFYRAIADRDYQDYVLSNKEKRWTDITKDELMKYYDFIFFLDANGVVYYLPLYMKLAIENVNIAEHQCTTCLFMAIIKLNPNILTIQQRHSIIHFLTYCRDVLDPELDLDEDLISEAIESIAR